ncbi:MAG: DUF4422 domain-containing protein [Bergeyella zoohelcum]|nr:DUF4422 domain-containing protein [Bergeyella zoohelcum]
MKNLKILVVSHKKYEFPCDHCYYPIQVGKSDSQQDLGVLCDNIGYHISEKNNSFCELTALYWAWKNKFFFNCEYIGLVHYRRYFKGNGLIFKNKKIASCYELCNLLREYDVILPKQRNYYIESVYIHYKNAHFVQDLDKAKSIISNRHPEYLESFEKVVNGKKLYLYNMFIMKCDLLNDYCEWLFDILFALEEQLDISQYNLYQKRVFGFISERLFNVWLDKNKPNKKELKVINLDGENLLKKALGLLKRKFLKEKE